jgi:hypothetical protein
MRTCRYAIFTLLLPFVVAIVSGCASSHEGGHDPDPSYPPSDDDIDDILSWEGVTPSIIDAFFAAEYAVDSRYCDCTGCAELPTLVTDGVRACFYVAAQRDPSDFIEYYGAWVEAYEALDDCYQITDCGGIRRGECRQDPPEILLHAPPASVAVAVLTCYEVD